MDQGDRGLRPLNHAKNPGAGVANSSCCLGSDVGPRQPFARTNFSDNAACVSRKMPGWVQPCLSRAHRIWVSGTPPTGPRAHPSRVAPADGLSFYVPCAVRSIGRVQMQRLVEFEAQSGLGRHLHRFPAGEDLGSGARRGSSHGANGSAFAVSGDGAN
jgi:hypothetical protein